MGNRLFTICWTGKLNLKRKCLPEIIEAMKKIILSIPDVQLVIGGRRGDGHSVIEGMIEKYGLSGNVTMLGEISEDQKIRYYQECILYLQPTRYEGFGLAIAEAMSCGAAVISTDAGEVRNLVGDCGIILDSCKPDVIGTAVIRALEDKDRILELGQKASARILEFFPAERRENDIKYYISQLAQTK
jgi:glycosyltransferase involved in cell wall biosynthesis